MSTIHERVSVIVEADAVVSIAIMKGDLTVLKESVGRLEVELTPGLYKARFASPTAIRDTIFEVSGNEAVVHVPVPADLTVASPAPLSAGTTSGDHESLASRLSDEPGVHLGQGASLFIFVRQLPHTPAPAGHPAAGVTLRTSSGQELFDLSNLSLHNGCTGVNLSVTPGTYLLRVERQNGAAPIEQSVVACAGWQTQIFLPLGPLTCEDKTPRPQLEHAAVFMAEEGQGFQPAKRASAWTEMARTWLARGEPVVPLNDVRRALGDARETRRQGLDPQTLHKMMREKLSNPMLGIYAAHLMIIHPHPDEGLMRELSDTLKELIGDHPDVLAIDLWLSGKGKPRPYDSPPMLRTSWDILVNRTREHGQLAPSGSYTTRIAGRLWGAGAWLIWCAPPPQAETMQTPEPIDVAALAALIRQRLGSHSPSEALRARARAQHFTPAEAAVFGYIANVIYGHDYVRQLAVNLEQTGVLAPVWKVVYSYVQPQLAKTATTFAHKVLTSDAMLQKLGIPAAALNEAAASLQQKLQAG